MVMRLKLLLMVRKRAKIKRANLLIY